MMTLKNKLIAILVGSNLADFYLTTLILSYGGTEVNPIMANLFEMHPYAPLLYKLVVLVVGIALLIKYQTHKRLIKTLVALNIVFSAVVFYSITLIWYFII